MSTSFNSYVTKIVSQNSYLTKTVEFTSSLVKTHSFDLILIGFFVSLTSYLRLKIKPIRIIANMITSLFSESNIVVPSISLIALIDKLRTYITTTIYFRKISIYITEKFRQSINSIMPFHVLLTTSFFTTTKVFARIIFPKMTLTLSLIGTGTGMLDTYDVFYLGQLDTLMLEEMDNGIYP